MSDTVKEAFANIALEDAEKANRMMKSQHLNELLDIKVMLEDGDVDQAIEYINDLTGFVKEGD